VNFIVSATTDIGLTKSTNQDSLSVKVINTPQGRMTFAILCDGMGGLEKGEVASASVIQAFDNWVRNSLPVLCEAPLEDSTIREQWNNIITEQNNTIKNYGARQGVKLGTTAVIMLITQTRYYVMNVGDSRAYEITDTMKQITNDQTFVAREVALGNMTEEEALTDERRNVLLQCVGASDEVYPDMFFDATRDGRFGVLRMPRQRLYYFRFWQRIFRLCAFAVQRHTDAYHKACGAYSFWRVFDGVLQRNRGEKFD